MPVFPDYTKNYASTIESNLFEAVSGGDGVISQWSSLL